MALAGYVTDRIKRRKPIVIFGYLIGRGILFFIPFIRDLAMLLLLALPTSMIFRSICPNYARAPSRFNSTKNQENGLCFQQFFMNGGVFIGSIIGGWITNLLMAKILKSLE